MNKKRLLALVLSGAMVAGSLSALAACSDGVVSDYDLSEMELAGTYKITVWNSETQIKDDETGEITKVSDVTAKQIARFNETNAWGVNIDATIVGISEAESATQMVSSVEDGADLFFFAQDQTMRLVQAGALAQLGNATTTEVKNRNDASAIAAATVGDKLVCYPLTSDNGYFMFYDKSVVKSNHIDSFEDIIKDCEDAGKTFAYELETSGWYNAGFFFATGCHSTWTTDDDGNFTEVEDNFNSDNGVIALQGMQKLLKSTSYVSSSKAEVFSAAIPAAVLISGTWESAAVKSVLGDENYGVADLPSFTVDGKSYHLGSYSGNKLLGVKPQVDTKRAAVLQQLALYLTNDECQLERFNTFGWGPSNKNAQNNNAVKSDPTLSALAQQNNYAVPQGQIHGSWWDISKVYATSAKDAAKDDKVALKAALQTYEDSMSALFNMSDEAKNAWSVIGDMFGDTWSKDISMTNKAGTWYSAPVYFQEGAEFKVRQGGGWDKSTGNTVSGATGYETLAAGNCKVTTAGLYIVKFSSTDETIELIPATLGVVGSINDWNSDEAMTKVEGENAYISAALTLPANAEFKVRYNGTWDYGDVGDGGDNYKVTEACTKKVKISWNTTNAAWELSLVD